MRGWQSQLVHTASSHHQVNIEKTAITSADLLNDRVLSWYQDQGVPLLRILTDRGSEYKGRVEKHAYELFLSVEGIVHTTTKAYSPQPNGMCERFNKTMKQEFFDTAMRKKLYTSLSALQRDLKEVAVEKHNELSFYKEASDSCQITDKIIV